MTVTRFIQHRVKKISLCAGDKVSQRKNILVPADKACNGDLLCINAQSIPRLTAALSAMLVRNADLAAHGPAGLQVWSRSAQLQYLQSWKG